VLKFAITDPGVVPAEVESVKNPVEDCEVPGRIETV
jgi:hypothetical protein